MRIGKKVYHSKRTNEKNAEIAEFSSPVEYITRANHITVMPASGFLAMMQYGEEISNTWTMIANANAFDGVFKVGDLMWVDGESPIKEVENTYGNGASANALIQSVAVGDRTISITLTRNKNQVKQ